MSTSTVVLSAKAEGDVLVCDEGLSFWGGVSAQTGVIQDALHPQCGESLSGRVVMMPSSRGSSSGSSILLGLAVSGKAPAALVFREPESTLTLGAIIAEHMFGYRIPIVRLSERDYAALSRQPYAAIRDLQVEAGPVSLQLIVRKELELRLTSTDLDKLAGRHGEAVKVAMEVIVAMAGVLSAVDLIDVSQVHIDACIYADPALLEFAQRMAEMKARVCVPTTLNAISVDHANWREQGVDEAFGEPASQLADTYVSMGARASFTCAPYLLESRPEKGEVIAWAESNAVVYANSVLGARTEKHSDMFDLCIAVTGRAPESGVYHSAGRAPGCIIDVVESKDADDSFWPLLGWLAGALSPEHIPLLRGLESSLPTNDDLKALCAAFGTTSAAPMVHVAGVTPEADLPAHPRAQRLTIGGKDFLRAWQQFNSGNHRIDLVALGSPHFSASESRAFLVAMNGRRVAQSVDAIITLGREVRSELAQDGTAQALSQAGVVLVSDVCWCSITEPVFPPSAHVVMTNSGKYAHYGPGLSGREVRFGSLLDCADSAVSGLSPERPPSWMGA